MQTRQGGRFEGPPQAPYPAATMRQALLTALTALAGCGLVIAVGAGMSICWAIHPLLTVAAFAGVVWLATRVAGIAFRHDGRRT